MDRESILAKKYSRDLVSLEDWLRNQSKKDRYVLGNPALAFLQELLNWYGEKEIPSFSKRYLREKVEVLISLCKKYDILD